MNVTQKTKNRLLYILKMKKCFGIEHIKEPTFSINTNNSLPTSYKVLKEYVNNCSLCELSKIKKFTFFDKGNVESKIYIVGLHIDFESELSYLKTFLNIDTIYMTNIIKCFTNKVHKNYDKEVEKCLPYFEQQITLYKPSLIIALGDAFKYIMKNNDSIHEISGNIFEYNSIKIVPLLDLNFINKNPSYADIMSKNLQKIKNILGEI